MPTCAARLSAEAGEGDKEFPLVLEEKVFNGRGRGFVIGNGKLQWCFNNPSKKVLPFGEDLGGVFGEGREGSTEWVINSADSTNPTNSGSKKWTEWDWVYGFLRIQKGFTDTTLSPKQDQIFCKFINPGSINRGSAV